MMILVLVLASLATSYAFAGPRDRGCGMHTPNPEAGGKIVGGSNAEYGEYPWLAGLQYKFTSNNDNAGFRCGGVLINKYWVLTTAECLELEGLNLTTVVLGMRELSKRETHDATKTRKFSDPLAFPHEGYLPYTKVNNIALLKLSKAVESTEWIAPICLPGADAGLPEDGTELTISGWGATQNTGSPGQDMKLKGEVTFHDYEKCREQLPNADVKAYQFCAEGREGVGSCHGDNGGPLMIAVEDGIYNRWTVLGLISDASGCGKHMKIAIHTRVSYYREWINKILAQN